MSDGSQNRQKLTKDRILTAAVSLADKEGLKAVSMRKVAGTLNVEAMSLYNHVRNKEDLIDGMVEQVASEFTVPLERRDWQGQMRLRAHSMHDVLMRHSWSPLLMVSRVNVGPCMLRHVDRTIGCLKEAGFSYPVADYAWNTLDSHIYGFTLKEISFPFQPEEFADAAQSYIEMIPPEKYPYLNQMSQQVMSGAHDGVQDFGFGLELVLNGLARILADKTGL